MLGGQLLEGLGYKFKDEVVDSWRNHLILTIDHFCQECVEKKLWMKKN